MSGSNFRTRVESIVDERARELLELFQDSEDRTGDLHGKLDRLISALPLIQDIKTEVNSIEKKLPHKKDDDDEKDEPESSEPTNPEDYKLLEELIKDMSNHMLTDETIKQLLLDSPGGLPIPYNPGRKRGLDTKDFFKFFFWAARKLKELESKINDSVSSWIKDHYVDQIRDQLQQIWDVTTIMNKYLIEDINKGISDVKEAVDDVQSALEECCQSTSDSLKTIKRKLDTFQPEADANKDLVLQSKTKSILAELQTLRGLL